MSLQHLRPCSNDFCHRSPLDIHELLLKQSLLSTFASGPQMSHAYNYCAIQILVLNWTSVSSCLRNLGIWSISRVWQGPRAILLTRWSTGLIRFAWPAVISAPPGSSALPGRRCLQTDKSPKERSA